MLSKAGGRNTLYFAKGNKSASGKRSMKWVAVIALVGHLACSTNSSQHSTEEVLDEYFRSHFPSDSPGGAVMIVRDGKVLMEKGYGLADLNSLEPITPNTAFNTGSISKTFVMYGILILEKEGLLSLDDPLIKYFPNIRNSQIGQKVTVFHLLHHSSGLIDSRRVQEDTVFYLTAKDADNFAPILENDSTAFSPGSQFQYSNPAFNGLALIMEKVTGKRWQDFIIERIFEPSGLKNSKITDGPYPESGVAHGYVFSEGKYQEDDYGEEPTFPAAGNGGVWSSVRDLYRYEKSQQEHRFLPNEITAMARTPIQPKEWASSEPAFIGYSWFTGTFRGERMIYHTGSQGGFVADYVWIPSRKIFYTILCNTPKPLDEYREFVLDQVWDSTH